MPKYVVPFEVYGTIEVEADNDDEARAKAHDGIGINAMDDHGDWDYWQIDGSTCHTPEEM